MVIRILTVLHQLCTKLSTLVLTVACTCISSLHIAHAATTTTTVEANIVSTINIVARNGIVFGDIGAGAIPGTVIIDVDGSRTSTGGASVNSNTSGTPASFEVSGDPNALYVITLPDSVLITSASGDSMKVDRFTSAPSAGGQLDSSGRQTLNVGARMNVDSFQPFGSYRGIMETTVEYN